MVKQALTLAVQDLWEEAFYLILFNFLCVISTLFFLLPFTLFGLFATLYDISQDKAIKFSTFFHHIKNNWQQAAIWGGVNYALLVIAIFNVNFYGQLNTPWAQGIQWLVMGVILAWGVIQLLVLGIYPYLTEPSYKLALQNAAGIMGLYPTPTLSLIIITICLVIISLIMPIILFVGTLIFIAAFTNRLIQVIFQHELRKQKEGS